MASEPEDCGNMQDESGTKVLIKRHIGKGETCAEAIKRVQEDWKNKTGKNLTKITDAEMSE
jgi:hypothetical protein